jgi:RIO kinase 2
MNLLLKFANHGVIHGDYNEFNIMITDDGDPVIIDFPQASFRLRSISVGA